MVLTFMCINLNYSSHYLSISVSLMILYIECIQLTENLFSKSKQEGAPVLVCCSMIIQLMYLMRLGGCRGEELEDHKISIVMIYLIKDSWRSPNISPYRFFQINKLFIVGGKIWFGKTCNLSTATWPLIRECS